MAEKSRNAKRPIKKTAKKPIRKSKKEQKKLNNEIENFDGGTSDVSPPSPFSTVACYTPKRSVGTQGGSHE